MSFWKRVTDWDRSPVYLYFMRKRLLSKDNMKRSHADLVLRNAAHKGVDVSAALPNLITRLRTSGIWEVGAGAETIGTLGMQGVDVSEAVPELVLCSLKNFGNKNGINALFYAATKEKNRKKIIEIIVGMVNNEDPRHRKNAVYVLVELADRGTCITEAIPVLIENLYNEEEEIRSWCLKALTHGSKSGRISKDQTKEIVGHLIIALEDEDIHIKDTAIQGIINICNIRETDKIDITEELSLTVRPLTKLLSWESEEYGKSMHLIMRVAVVLSQISKHVNVSEAVPDLIEALLDEDKTVRREVLHVVTNTLTTLVENGTVIRIEDIRKRLEEFVETQPPGKRKKAETEVKEILVRISVEIRKGKQRMQGKVSEGTVKPPTGRQGLVRIQRRLGNG